MSSITKTAKGYRAQVKILGQRDSATFRTKREAEAWASARENEIRSGPMAPNLGPIDAPKTLADAMNRYSEEVSPTHKGSRWEFIRLQSLLKDPNLPTTKPLPDLTPEDLGAWRNARLAQVQAGTVIREFALLSGVLETARREWRWTPVNPLSDVKRPRAPDHREVTITRQQIRKMLEAMGYKRGECRTVAQSAAVAFLFALRTGMRAGEICALTWPDVRGGYCTVTAKDVGAGKTGKRDVPLTDKAARLIEAMRGYDPLYVFGLRTASLDAMFRKYRARAGLEGFTFHDSRHTAATWMAGKVDVLTLCKIMGWKNTNMALTYYNPKASDIAKRL